MKKSATKKSLPKETVVRWRFFAACFLFVFMASAVLVRLVQVQALPSQDYGYEFLQGQGDARVIRNEIINAHRGVISDRNGEPLAVSTRVVTICADPKMLNQAKDQWPMLAKNLGMPLTELSSEAERYKDKGFMYLKRHLPPEEASKALALKVPGVFSRNEYQRFYPAYEVAAHVIGMTNIDGEGQEGIELAYNNWLRGIPGNKVIKKDLMGRVIEEVRLVKSAQPGNDLTLSLDMRLQYLAYRALKNAVTKHNAVSGSIVILDSRTSEVLAMVNQPSYNPNNRATITSASQLKNRAVTDQFEPGSTMKSLTTLAALESGRFGPRSKIDTSPGRMRLSGKTIHDPVNYGELDLTRILTKSSQVGITKVALQLDPFYVREIFFRMGIGQTTGTGFPGETTGTLPSPKRWNDVQRATFAYGYGLDTTTLQLAQAYAVIANDGKKNPVSLLRLSDEDLAKRQSEQVVSAEHSRQVMRMLETVLSPDGTGKRAALEGYSAGGKTGTAHKSSGGGYQVDEKFSVFVGVAPIQNPRIVVAIMVDEPRSGIYSGGEVSAPVFAAVADSALRILQVVPDKLTHSESGGDAEFITAQSAEGENETYRDESDLNENVEKAAEQSVVNSIAGPKEPWS